MSTSKLPARCSAHPCGSTENFPENAFQPGSHLSQLHAPPPRAERVDCWKGVRLCSERDARRFASIAQTWSVSSHLTHRAGHLPGTPRPIERLVASRLVFVSSAVRPRCDVETANDRDPQRAGWRGRNDAPWKESTALSTPAPRVALVPVSGPSSPPRMRPSPPPDSLGEGPSARFTQLQVSVPAALAHSAFEPAPPAPASPVSDTW